MTEDTSIISTSLCKICAFRICRLIIPPDYYWEETGEEPDEEMGQVIEHNYCKMLEMPIDHIVLECNKFTPGKEISLLENDRIIYDT